jgi:hypothetical protein
MGNRLAVRVSCDDTPIFFVSALLLVDDGLHGNNQISGEAQDVLWKLEERKVWIADKPGVE